MAQNGSDQGYSEAHTPAAPRASAPAGDLFAPAFEPEGAEGQTIAPPAGKRPPGRPPGSPNRTTLQLQRLLLARGYRDPAEFHAAVMSADVRQLAADLAGHGNPRLVTFDQAVEVAKLQLRSADALMPYFHQRMPQQVQIERTDARPVIVINDLPSGRREVVTGAGAMSAHDAIEIEQDQGLSGDEAAPSHEARVS